MISKIIGITKIIGIITFETFSTSFTVKRNYQFLIDFPFLSNCFYLELRSKITQCYALVKSIRLRMAPFDIFV